MPTIPCALCGYHAPEPRCPHCALAPAEKSLARAPAVAGVWEGLVALPRGMALLARTPGTKRWLVPPLVITALILAVALTAALRALGRWVDDSVPNELGWREAGWLEGLAEGWSWLHAALAPLVVAVEWLAELVLGALTSGPFSWLAGFLVASLVVWYCFSIAYEAVAGPFLDEVQGRLETRWFGADPRDALERPNDLPPADCAKLSAAAGAVAVLAVGAVLLAPASAWWTPLAALLPFTCLALAHRRYGQWLAWVARIEGRALLVGLQASLVTGALVVLALPLYLVPLAGYFLYAAVTGFATSVALLDLAAERRGWSLRQRMSFMGRHLVPLTVFGAASGLLLAVPLLGPVLMVPCASVGGLWLLCRLDKNFMRPPGSRMEFRGAPGTVAP